MKPLPILLVLSLAANAALALWALRSAPDTPAAGANSNESATVASGEVVVTKEVAERAAAAEALTNAVKRGDAVAVRDHLRALGMPDEVVRSAVRAVLYKPVSELSNEIANRQNKDGQAYWKTLPFTFSPQSLSKEDRARMREASRAAARKLDELVGPDPQDPTTRLFSYLGSEKVAKIRELQSDYNELRSQVYGEQDGFRVPSDEEKLAYLQAEQRKDLAALLTPEELAEYDKRSSSTAERLRFQLRSFDATEDEYGKIFALTKAFDDTYRSQRDPGSGRTLDYAPADNTRQHADPQQELMDNLRAALGEERFKDYLRSQDKDYTTLKAAARRFNLPEQTVNDVYAARDQAVAEAQRISNDANLSPQQRTQALAALARQTRSRVQTHLPGEVGTAYLRNNMRWLDALQRGQPISVTPLGTVTVGRPATPSGPNSTSTPFTGSVVSPPARPNG